MKIHRNARLTPKGREILVRRIVNGDFASRKPPRPQGSACARPTSGWPGIVHRDEEVSGTVLRVRTAARIALGGATCGDSGPAPRPMHLSRD